MGGGGFGGCGGSIEKIVLWNSNSTILNDVWLNGYSTGSGSVKLPGTGGGGYGGNGANITLIYNNSNSRYLNVLSNEYYGGGGGGYGGNGNANGGGGGYFSDSLGIGGGGYYGYCCAGGNNRPYNYGCGGPTIYNQNVIWDGAPGICFISYYV